MVMLKKITTDFISFENKLIAKDDIVKITIKYTRNEYKGRVTEIHDTFFWQTVVVCFSR